MQKSSSSSKGRAKADSDERSFPNPYPTTPTSDLLVSTDLCEKLKKAIARNLAVIEENGRVDNQSLYTGQAGLSLLNLQVAYRVYDDSSASRSHHLQASLRTLEPCLMSLKRHRVTFLCGAAGPLALAAHLYHLLGDIAKSRDYIVKLKGLIPSEGMTGSELLYGRAGYLYALLYVGSLVPGAGQDTKDLVEEQVRLLLDAGQMQAQADASPCPLSYIWHGKHYLGAAHGLAGILTVLLQVSLDGVRERIKTTVQPCVDYLLTLCFPSGNLPSSLESGDRDRLVQWCHGAPGLVHLLTLAYKVFGQKSYLDAALRCGDVVWERGLLIKGYSLCHGVAGNAYTFLQLYRLTGDSIHLNRAVRFAEWCLSSDERQCHTPDHPYSMFEGLAGITYFYCDLLKPEKASFPALQLWTP